MLVQKFEKFLKLVDLKSYRDKYRPIKRMLYTIVGFGMGLKNIQTI